MWLRSLRRAFNVAFPLLLVLFLLVPTFKAKQLSGRTLELRKQIAAVMRPLSLSQQWGMYAPDPARAAQYLTLEAHYEDGSTRELPETARSQAGFGTTWALSKTRMDIWRFRLVQKGIRRPNRARTWYLRGICVRESREGWDPKRIQLFQLKRRFRPPEQVRAGKGEFFPPRITKSESGWCRSRIVRDMIALDEANNGPHLEAPVEDLG
jgi:hypothetical protein